MRSLGNSSEKTGMTVNVVAAPTAKQAILEICLCWNRPLIDHLNKRVAQNHESLEQCIGFNLFPGVGSLRTRVVKTLY